MNNVRFPTMVGRLPKCFWGMHPVAIRASEYDGRDPAAVNRAHIRGAELVKRTEKPHFFAYIGYVIAIVPN